MAAEGWPDLLRLAPALVERGAAIARSAAEIMKTKAPVYVGPDPDRVGGGLRESIEGSFDPLPDGIRVNVTSDRSYAKFVIRGTAAHIIEAYTAGSLRWWGWDGELHFARVVHHPGTQPNPFPQEAAAEIRDMALWELKLATGVR